MSKLGCEIACGHMADGSTRSSSFGRIALFNGPPSSGKTSLVRALQRELLEPWFHLSLDDFRSGLTEGVWLVDDGSLFDRVLSGYLGSLGQIAAAGINVLAEAVITPARQRMYQEVFGETALVLIGVSCPLGLATTRERTRTDRRCGPIELVADDFAAVHAGLSYDFEVATDGGSPEELAASMAPHFDQLVPSSFERHLTQPSSSR